MRPQPDRGTFGRLAFEQGTRGFVLYVRNIENDRRYTFAFDRIEDLAAWLVEQYRDIPGEHEGKGAP